MTEVRYGCEIQFDIRDRRNGILRGPGRLLEVDSSCCLRDTVGLANKGTIVESLSTGKQLGKRTTQEARHAPGWLKGFKDERAGTKTDRGEKPRPRLREL